MERNKYIIKVLTSCRTIAQLDSCYEWAIDNFELYEPVIFDDREVDSVACFIIEMRRYLRRTERGTK